MGLSSPKSETGVALIDPYWQWSRPTLLPPLPPLPPGRHAVDVAIIGAGLAGLSVAFHLLRRHPGRRVLVLEAATIGGGASARSTGMLSPGVGQSLPALVRRLGASAATDLYTQTLAAVRDTSRLIAEEAIDCDLHLGGQLIYARRPSERRRLAVQARLMEKLGLADSVEVLDDRALAARLQLAECALTNTQSPQPAAGPAALRFPTAGVLDPLRLLVGLCERVLARGGAVHEGTRVLDIADAAPGGAVCLRVPDGEVLAQQVVVATAGFAPQLGLLPGRLLPVQLQALVTSPLSDSALAQLGWRDRDGVLDARRLFNYFRLTADRRIVFGGGRPRYGWGDTDRSDRDLGGALQRLRAEFFTVFPSPLGVQPVGGWSGTIGYVLDALPIIGRVPGRPRIVQAVGWCGHGVALATACGPWVVDLLDEKTPPAQPWFRGQAPRVPTEIGRRIGFAATTQVMALQDRWS
jgi:gamma-glutamylputrescine oxidase